MEKAELIIQVKAQGVPAALGQLKRVEEQAARTARQMKQVCGLSQRCAGRALAPAEGLAGQLNRACPSPPGAGSGGDDPWGWDPEELFSGLTLSLAEDWRESLASLEQSGQDLFGDLGDSLEDGFGDMAGGMTDGFQDLCQDLSGGLEGLLNWDPTDLWDDLAHGLEGLFDLNPEEMFGGLSQSLGQWLDGLLDLDMEGLLDDFSGWLEDLTGLDLGGLFGDFSDWLGGLLDLDFGNLWNGLMDGLSGILNLDGLLDSITQGLGDILDLGGLFDSLTGGLGDLFDGIFSGEISPEQARAMIAGTYAYGRSALESVQGRVDLSLLDPLAKTLQDLEMLGSRAGYTSEQIDQIRVDLMELSQGIVQTAGEIVMGSLAYQDTIDLYRQMNMALPATIQSIEDFADAATGGSDALRGMSEQANGAFDAVNQFGRSTLDVVTDLQNLGDGLEHVAEEFNTFNWDSGGSASPPPSNSPPSGGGNLTGGGNQITINSPIQINQQPGEDADALADRVMSRQNELYRRGLDASTTRHGTVKI